MNFKKPILIAEVGCNHKGELETAMKFIKIAKEFCNVPCIKFQKRDPKTLLSEEEYNLPHPVEQNSYGKTYGEHREFLEFSKNEHKELMNYCGEIGIEYSTSVWDVTSAKEISELNPTLIKVPSASNTHYEMLEVSRDDYKGDVHVSFGMTTKNEQQKLIDFFQEKNQAKERLVVYSCTSGYPVSFDFSCMYASDNNLV